MFSWKILRVDCYQTLTDSTGTEFHDVIYALQWQITGQTMADMVDPDTGEAYQVPTKSAWVYDSLGLTINLSGSYTQRSDVTEEQLIGWVKNILGPEKIAELETQVTQMLEAM